MTKLVIPRRNISTVLSGLGACAGLSAVLCGVPILLLLEMPSPVPDRWPPFSGLVSRTFAPSTTHVWMALLGILAWLAWLWFAVAIVLEVAAVAWGMKAPKMPGARLGQNLVAWLVGSVVLLALLHVEGQGISRRQVAVRGKASAISVVAGGTGSSAGWLHDSESAGGSASGDAEATARFAVFQGKASAFASGSDSVDRGMQPRGYVVRSGDTLWSIAASELQDPLRWTEIARLNYGKLQAGGATLTDSHWLHPGWILEMPSIDGRWPSRLLSQASPVGPASTQDQNAQAASPPACPEGAGSARSSNGAPTGTAKGRDSIPLLPIGGSLLGLGLVATLERMRRAQQRHRRSGGRIRLPDAEMVQAERRLRLSEDREASSDVNQALKVLGSVLAVHPEGSLPAVVGARLAKRTLEILLDDQCRHPLCVPKAFEVRSGTSSWFLDRQVLPKLVHEIRGLGLGEPGLAFPAFVSLGRDDSGLLLANLEAAGSLAVFGDKELVGGTLAGMAVELASSPWAECADIYLVGFGSNAPNLASLERITGFESISQVMTHLEVLASDSKKLLDASGFHRFDFARIAGGGAVWEPTIVVCGQELTEGEAEEILDLAGDGSTGIAVVLAGEVSGARWMARIVDDKLMVPPLGTVVRLQYVAETELGAIGRLLEVASDVGGMVAVDGAEEHSKAFPLTDLGDQDYAQTAIQALSGRTVRGAPSPSAGPVSCSDSLPSGLELRAQPMVGAEGLRIINDAKWLVAPEDETDRLVEGHCPGSSFASPCVGDRRGSAEPGPGLPAVAGASCNSGILSALGYEPGFGRGEKPEWHPAQPERPSIERCPRVDESRIDGLVPGLVVGNAEREPDVVGGTTSPPDAPVPDGTRGVAVRSEGESGIEVEVLVLGPVEIRGAERPMMRAGATELVVYLAMHRCGVASDAWATALWPDRVMAPSSLHSTASEARRALGRASNGHDHLPRQHGRLELAGTVGTDWHRFVELAKLGTPQGWHDALALVRGEAFEGLRAGDWTILEGFSALIEAQVVDAATSLAEHSLVVGDANGAEWAARQGLRISHYDERLYRILMRAADAAGNPAGVERVMDELISVVAEEVEPYDVVHPETAALYSKLARRRRMSPAGSHQRTGQRLVDRER